MYTVEKSLKHIVTALQDRLILAYEAFFAQKCQLFVII